MQVKGDFQWRGCSHDLRFGSKYSRRFLTPRDGAVQTIQTMMQAHNSKLGRKVNLLLIWGVGWTSRSRCKMEKNTYKMMFHLCIHSLFSSEQEHTCTLLLRKRCAPSVINKTNFHKFSVLLSLSCFHCWRGLSSPMNGWLYFISWLCIYSPGSIKSKKYEM